MLWFTCYDPDTDEVLSIGPAQECAEGLGLTPATFYNYIYRARAGRICPYTFVVEDLDTGRMTTLHAVKEEPPAPSPGVQPARLKTPPPQPWERAG